MLIKTNNPLGQTVVAGTTQDSISTKKVARVKTLSPTFAALHGKHGPWSLKRAPGAKAGVPIATVSKSRALENAQRQSPPMQLPLLGPASQASETRLMLARRLGVIASHLKQLDPARDKETLKIFVGCEDFLKGGDIAANFCMDPETVYESIATDMRALSKQHPGVVLCPGSVYVSTGIPASHGMNDLKFEQDGRRARLDSTTCYTTNLMPVLYDGEVVAIIRKGERAEFRHLLQNNKKKPVSHPLEDIDDLSRFDHQPGRLSVTSYHEDNLTDLTDGKGKTSTCYLGKTLMPGERALIERHILKNSDRTIDELGRHDATIAGKRFLFLVCAEFRLINRQGENISTAGKLLSDDTAPPFDFIIHSSVGGDVPDAMQKKARWYVHADFGGFNKVVTTESPSPLVPRFLEDQDSDHELFVY